MSEPVILKLARDLEWLGCELEYQGMKHAHEGFPEAGPTWEAFVRQRQGVLATIEKLERELKSSVKYNPTSLVGVTYPIGEALDAIAIQIEALEDIRSSAVGAVNELPVKVRGFTQLVQMYLNVLGQQGSGKRPSGSR
ncbi:MAG: hypothetical protein HY508_13015 [Acidobacteria bacterium]|nr:hypothetical protein [Acidobacteriota bacterium]